MAGTKTIASEAVSVSSAPVVFDFTYRKNTKDFHENLLYLAQEARKTDSVALKNVRLNRIISLLVSHSSG